jgi:hypothetical protein
LLLPFLPLFVTTHLFFITTHPCLLPCALVHHCLPSLVTVCPHLSPHNLVCELSVRVCACSHLRPPARNPHIFICTALVHTCMRSRLFICVCSHMPVFTLVCMGLVCACSRLRPPALRSFEHACVRACSYVRVFTLVHTCVCSHAPAFMLIHMGLDLSCLPHLSVPAVALICSCLLPLHSQHTNTM